MLPLSLQWPALSTNAGAELLRPLKVTSAAEQTNLPDIETVPLSRSNIVETWGLEVESVCYRQAPAWYPRLQKPDLQSG